MRLLILVSSMHGGGAERVAALLANAWASAGESVTLMPTFSGRGECVYALDDGVELRFLADHVGGALGRVGRLLALRRQIQALEPDRIIAFLPHVNVAALIASLGLDIPVIVSERTYPPLLSPQAPALTRLLRRIFYPRAHRVVVQTQDVADWVDRRCPGARPAVIPNPVTFPLPASQPVAAPAETAIAGRPFVVGAGRLIPSKRFDILIKSFAAAAQTRPDWRLALLGDGPERKSLEQLATELGVRDRVWFAGFVGNAGDWYSAASAYVLTSSYEGFPNTLLEAMAYGLPSIAFDIKTGPRDIMDGGRRGVLLPDDQHVARLTPALAELMDQPSLRETLSRSAQQVREVFASDRVMRLWDNAIDRSTGQQASGAP